MTEDGRMIIKEEDDDEDEEDEKKSANNNNNNKKKRKRGDDDDDEEADPAQTKMKKGPANKKQKLNAGQAGDLYASKYAAGDMKKAGRPDPYAYIKFDPKFLNKRCVYNRHYYSCYSYHPR